MGFIFLNLLTSSICLVRIITDLFLRLTALFIIIHIICLFIESLYLLLACYLLLLIKILAHILKRTMDLILLMRQIIPCMSYGMFQLF